MARKTKTPKAAEVQTEPVVTFPDGSVKKASELTEADNEAIALIVQARLEDILKGSSEAIEGLLNPFGMTAKVVILPHPIGASDAEIAEMFRVASLNASPSPLT